MRKLILIAGLGFAVAGVTSAKPQSTLPPNTIDCSAFTKMPSGIWHVSAGTTFDLGNIKSINLGDMDIGPHLAKVGNIDLYDVLERKCGAHEP
jgi:hypothetical protein